MSFEPSRLEAALGRVLVIGSVASTVLLVTGLTLALAKIGSDLDDILLTGGVFALIVTPIARVVVSMMNFARDRDWTFFCLTTTVLFVLLASWLLP
jgi:uncharacterized membrane protein